MRHPGKERPTKATGCPAASSTHSAHLHQHPRRPLLCTLTSLEPIVALTRTEAACGICPLLCNRRSLILGVLASLNPASTTADTLATTRPLSPVPVLYAPLSASRHPRRHPAICVLTLALRASRNRVSTLYIQSACFVSLPLCSLVSPHPTSQRPTGSGALSLDRTQPDSPRSPGTSLCVRWAVPSLISSSPAAALRCDSKGS